MSMNVSRRKFMKAGIMVAAFAGLPLTAQIAKAGEAKIGRSKTLAGSQPSFSLKPLDTIGYYNRSTFAGHVNTEFRVHLGQSKVSRIKLVAVRDVPGASQESFSLLFSGAKGKGFPQKTYKVEHAALGKFSLFLVPVGMRTRSGPEYFEAVFNRS
jgi:hypothetical protein